VFPRDEHGAVCKRIVGKDGNNKVNITHSQIKTTFTSFTRTPHIIIISCKRNRSVSPRRARGCMQAGGRQGWEQQSQSSHTLKSKQPLLLSRGPHISSSSRVNVTEVFLHTTGVSESRDSPKAPFSAIPHDTFSHVHPRWMRRQGTRQNFAQHKYPSLTG